MAQSNILRIDLEGDEFHKKFGGGLPRKSFVLIEAEDGLGKSVLSQRFAYGVLSNKNSVSYISSELNLTEFLNQMESLNYAIKTHLLNKQLKFVTLFPSKYRVELNGDLIQQIITSKVLFESDMIIFDTLNELLIDPQLDLRESFKLVGFFKEIVSRNKTIVFCVTPDFAKGKFFGMLKSSADVYIKMLEKEQYGNVLKVIKIERFNAAEDEYEKEIPFNVKAKIGILPDISS
ncbi:MAG: ATPase domain-containing protein [Candidatus Woesearchaeota archaeon]